MTLSSNLGFGFDASTQTPGANRIPQASGSGKIAVGWIPDFVASGGSHAPGRVPDPGSSSGTTRFLCEDATWQVPAGGGGGVSSVNTRTGSVTLVATDIPVFIASGGSHAVGAVPDPGSSSGTTRFLREDATWVVPAYPVTSVNTRTGAVTLVATDIPVFIASGGSHAVGTVPDPGSSAGTTKFLREDATWQIPAGSAVSSVNTRTGAITLVGTDIPVFVASGGSHAVGAVPDPGSSSGTSKFLREDASWAIPASSAVSSVNTRTGAITLVATDIPVFIASGGSHAVGAVPDPGSSSGTTKFLREDATWQVPAGGGGGGGDLLTTLVNAESAITGTASPSTFDTMYKCSGTSANYAVTLPAVSGNGGKFMGFRGDTAANLTKVVSITPAGSETIGGRAGGASLALLWDEQLILYCDGARWNVISHTNAGWQSFTPTITGATSNPTKGGSLTETCRWRRDGSMMQLQFYYYQGTAGAAGTGEYIIAIPGGFLADTTVIVVGDSSTFALVPSAVGDGWAISPSLAQSDYVVFTRTTSAIHIRGSGGALFGSTTNINLGVAQVTVTFFANIPIAGW